MGAAVTSLDDELTRFWASEPDAIQDVFPFLARLREGSPVHVHGDLVFVSEHEDCKRVLTDRRRFSNEFMADHAGRVQRLGASVDADHREAFEQIVELERMLTFHSDGEEHDRRRRALHRLFTPTRVAQFEDVTQAYFDEVLAEIEGDEVVDLAPWMRRLPSWVIAFLLGVPREDCPRLAEWVGPIAKNLHNVDHLDEAYAAGQRFQAYLDGLIEDHERHGREETELFAAIRAGAEGFGAMRLLGIFVEMNLGGVESTRGLLQGSLVALLEHRDQWDRLVADPSLLPTAVEELLRYVAPGLWTTRIPLAETELRGVRIAPDQTIIVLVGGANRDPAVFDDPEALDVGRPNARQHLALGHGPHYCLGQALARLELNVVLRTLLSRYPDLELVGPIVRSGGAQNPAIDRIDVRLGRRVG